MRQHDRNLADGHHLQLYLAQAPCVASLAYAQVRVHFRVVGASRVVGAQIFQAKISLTTIDARPLVVANALRIAIGRQIAVAVSHVVEAVGWALPKEGSGCVARGGRARARRCRVECVFDGRGGRRGGRILLVMRT